jgi:hypothetical protein
VVFLLDQLDERKQGRRETPEEVEQGHPKMPEEV